MPRSSQPVGAKKERRRRATAVLVTSTKLPRQTFPPFCFDLLLLSYRRFCFGAQNTLNVRDGLGRPIRVRGRSVCDRAIRPFGDLGQGNPACSARPWRVPAKRASYQFPWLQKCLLRPHDKGISSAWRR